MKTNHTPGPWSINGNKIDGNGYHIASVNSHGTTEGRANHKLIAAAPDLLDAAQLFVRSVGVAPDEVIAGAFGADTLKALNKARNAIAKAEGR